FACVGSRSGSEDHEDGGRADVATFATIMTSLLARLQDNEGDRVETYLQLESVLRRDNSHLQRGVVNGVLAEVSGDMRAAQGAMTDVTTAACDVLVSLAASHFEFVMSELQGHLKTLRGACKEFVLITLSKLAHSYG
ncbi:MRO2A protein, partial [Alectura lathami]|nr:MRO2A protein [Alectura lathami]